MKRLILATLCLLYSGWITVSAQERIDSITKQTFEDGKALFMLKYTWALGIGAIYPDNTSESMDGFQFPYVENGVYKLVLYHPGNKPKVYSTASFSNGLGLEVAKVDRSERDFTEREARICRVYQRAIHKVATENLFPVEDPRFSPQVIPVVTKTGYKVYFFPASKDQETILVGGDLELEFDSSGNWVATTKLHESMVSHHNLEANTQMPDTGYTWHYHSDQIKPFSPTDVCMAFYFKVFGKWRDYLIISNGRVYFLDCEFRSLQVWDAEEYKHRFARKDYHGRWRPLPEETVETKMM